MKTTYLLIKLKLQLYLKQKTCDVQVKHFLTTDLYVTFYEMSEKFVAVIKHYNRNVDIRLVFIHQFYIDT